MLRNWKQKEKTREVFCWIGNKKDLLVVRGLVDEKEDIEKALCEFFRFLSLGKRKSVCVGFCRKKRE